MNIEIKGTTVYLDDYPIPYWQIFFLPQNIIDEILQKYYEMKGGKNEKAK